ncbi:MAG TPA: acetoacetate decarboxylase family protein [Dongiaceae bacterium]|nr:acetoacetate decarboxylase family protein [Dongiaceae bacterium]
MQIDPFFQVPQHTHPTSAGEVQLPLLFKEADAVLAMFLCDLDRVKQQLEGTGLEPALVIGRQAIVILAIYDFLQSTIGPYRSVPLTIPVWRDKGFRPISPWRELFQRADKRHMGYYMVSAATNTALSYTTGRELWGFPKHMARIDYQQQRSRLGCRVYVGDEPLLEFGGIGFPISWNMQLDSNMFSIRQDQLLRTLVNTRGRFRAYFPMGYRLHVGDREHPFTQTARVLGLHGKRPLAVVTSSDYQGRMDEGAVVEKRQPVTTGCAHGKSVNRPKQPAQLLA